MRAELVIASTIVLACLGGCASITTGTTQPVSVTAVCEGAIVPATPCTLVNDKGRWEVITPQAVLVQKSYGDLSVTCRKDASSGTASFVSKPNSGVWGNVIAGGLIGYAVDSANGAGFSYPTETAVVLSSPCPYQ
jgi:hypothetical protein